METYQASTDERDYPGIYERIHPERPATKTYRLPPRFYWDHVERDCAGGTLIRETKTYVEVALDRESYDDLLSDARYYSDASQFDSHYRGLCASARATAKKLTGIDQH